MAIQVSTPTTATTLATSAQIAGANVAPVEVAVSSTPPNVEQLLRQISISGTLAAPADAGIVTLATALGNFSFSLAQIPDAVKQQLVQQLDALFQNQKPLTAVLQPGSPPTQAVLLLPATASGTQTAALPSAGNPQPQALPQTLSLTPGTALPAVVLPPNIAVPGSVAATPATSATPPTPAAQPAIAAPPNATPTAPAAANPATITATAPATTPAPSNAAAPPAANPLSPVVAPAFANQPPAQTAPPALPPATALLLQPGKEVVVRVDAVALPASPPPTPTNANQVAATVIGNGTNGQLILKAGDATLYVRASVEAPVGTNLLVSVEAPKPSNPAVLPPMPEQNFASLQQTIDAIAQINPQLAQQLLETHIPQPNIQLAGPLLFFLSALKQGDAKGWLGSEAADALTKGGKIELLTKLVRDMNASPQTERDPTVGEWKSYPVPLQMNGQMQTLTLHVHGEGHNANTGGEQSAAPNHVRFLIDVRMSRLGQIQLDGLVRPKKLDMIVRSESPLPPGLPQDLRHTYLSTIEAIGFTGGLSFQTGRQHWLSPRKEMPQSVVT